MSNGTNDKRNSFAGRIFKDDLMWSRVLSRAVADPAPAAAFLFESITLPRDAVHNL
jgi:hypothetical protein